MRKKNFKGRCEKRQVSKCEDICRTYDDIQRAYLERLEANKNIKSILLMHRVYFQDAFFLTTAICIDSCFYSKMRRFVFVKLSGHFCNMLIVCRQFP